MVPIAPVINAGWVDDASLLPPPPPPPPHPAIMSMTTASTTVSNRFIANSSVAALGRGTRGCELDLLPGEDRFER